jgi:hypothetical protein
MKGSKTTKSLDTHFAVVTYKGAFYNADPVNGTKWCVSGVGGNVVVDASELTFHSKPL